MTWVSRTLNSSVGSKTIMAITGILLVGFLIAHLAGNLLVFAGPQALNLYAERLRDYLPLLWVLRIGLLVAVVAHIYTSIRLTRLNRQARPHAYKVKRSVKASLTSRTMLLSGLTILFFILYHLAHLTLRWTHREAFAGLGEYDVYQMMVISFRSPVVSGFYVIAISLLMMHLNHGIASFFQSLGLNHPRYNACLRRLGQTLSVLLAAGFISIPLAILFGIVK